MKKFSRTAEKVLAWIANVILLFFTIVFSIVSFSGSIESVMKTPEFKTALKTSLMEAGQINALTDTDIDNFANIIGPALYGISIALIVISVLALIASFTMKKRVFSGVLFLILAIVILVGTVGAGFIVYVPYFIVAIMLFVRKLPVDRNNFYSGNTTEEVEKIEYV